MQLNFSLETNISSLGQIFIHNVLLIRNCSKLLMLLERQNRKIFMEVDYNEFLEFSLSTGMLQKFPDISRSSLTFFLKNVPFSRFSLSGFPES